MRLIRALPIWFLLILWAVPQAMASSLAFVMNSGGASISLIDMATLEGTPPHPRAARAAPLGADARTARACWSAIPPATRLLFFDPATGALQRRMPCADPYQLGFSPNGKFLVVNGLARNQVDVYDAATLRSW